MDKRLKLLPLLRSFNAAATCSSYSLAAEKLAVTQAAISQQIRALEQHLGCKLFTRIGRTMQLTHQGKILHEYVDKAFSHLSDGFNSIQGEPLEGVLTVTSSPSFCSRWLVPRLWKFSLLYPSINVRAVASHQYEDVRHSSIDLAIRQGDKIFEQVHQEPLLASPVFAVCSPKVARELDLNSPASVAKCWLVEAIDPGPFSWKNWLNIASVPFDPQKLFWMEVTTWDMAINAVAGGHGICLSATCMSQDMLDNGLLVKPFDIQLEERLTYTLVYDDASPRLARIEAFRTWLRQELREQDPQALVDA